MYLRKNAGGFIPKPIVSKTLIQSRVGLGVKGKAGAEALSHGPPRVYPCLENKLLQARIRPNVTVADTGTLNP